ncbi:hypothetical protein T552_00731 [Pneumocystis carinii B80]|uniref:Tetratricopeptide SHNi-TPR domain-containing protein n=1 Tax=Pneumocystis carinii (strain B80) TaxID=1408658 RepID=A0A0W4ZPD7_PNEC8|nr:hypothetical protein T552_00731 [Pneumocystis carinii B80]KTW30254.1 hypothetical protein T552_00731 [Pneumocystis carinii B80]
MAEKETQEIGLNGLNNLCSEPSETLISLEEAYSVINEADCLYYKKDYEAAVEKYSLALERIVMEYGEGDVRNADVFYSYGRALFYLAVKRSGVFGGVVPPLENCIEMGNVSSKAMHNSSRLCFSGDESSEEESGDVIKEDDFSIAWEALDFSRFLYQKMLDMSKGVSERDLEEKKEEIDEEKCIEIEKKLADTYDLLGEISLENENFQQALADFQSSLDLRTKIYPLESSLITEAHYKLALALEFSQEGDFREKAIEHIHLAIKSLEKRLENEQKSEKGKEKQEKEESEIREMLLELKQKAKELEKIPEKTSIKTLDFQNITKNSQEDVKKALLEMISNANDVNSLVKKKKKPISYGLSNIDENQQENQVYKKAKIENSCN